MSRIYVVKNENASPEQQAVFQDIRAQFGLVPNFLRVLANSPAAAKAFLGLYANANQGLLDPQTRERIALALAQQNSCEYCLSAHAALGAGAGLDDAEMSANRAGSSRDEKAAAAIKFARALVAHTGEVTTAEVMEVRNAGYTDAELVEIIVHVGINLLTNILGKASRVAIDFPKVELKQAV